MNYTTGLGMCSVIDVIIKGWRVPKMSALVL